MDCQMTERGKLIGEPCVDATMEHRWGQRIPCRARVRVSGGAGVTESGRMRDVSMSGAFIETSAQLPLFAPVAVAVLREDRVDDSELLGCVVRREPGGVAVEWAEVLPGPVCPLLGCSHPCGSPQRQSGESIARPRAYGAGDDDADAPIRDR
jgi:hypothetical protein